MDASEYDLAVFHRGGFHRRSCAACGEAFWTLGDHTRCQEAPCTPYEFLGKPIFRRAYKPDEMRETFLSFFERRGHQRIGRYPTVARWRNDVFFTQASIYDFQPWVTSGAIPPPANPLTICQPCLRFNDLEEVGRSGRHFSGFEMMAHHAFNRPDHEVYFKDRTVELCHELLTETLGADPKAITYKEEEWEGGGNLGPSLSVGAAGLEVSTLVFMEYERRGGALVPMPLTVVDTGYGLERFTWASQGTRTAYEAVFGELLEEVRRTFPPREAALLVDHARTLNFLLTDGVVPSNSKDGYFARLVLRRVLRTLAKVPEAPDILALLDRVARDVARAYPEVGDHREDLHRVVRAEVERYAEAIERARGQIRRVEERKLREGSPVTSDDLVEWYDSLGVTPDVAVQELTQPPEIPEDFYARLAARHEKDRPEGDYGEKVGRVIEVPATVPETEALYFKDPYTLRFEAHVVHVDGPYVVLDRTYFYPTGGGQITDTGSLGDGRVVEVTRHRGWIVHQLDEPARCVVGERVHGAIDASRRQQLMAHHTATHLLNGALRESLGRHVWQAGAYKGVEAARIDITHFRALTPEEVRAVERRVNHVVREDRPVRSYFEARAEAERRFGFTLYQGGAVPGKDLRIVEIEGFDVEACGGTHCTHTSEVGLVSVLGTERIQDGIVRLTFAAGDRALDLVDARREALNELGRKLGVGIDQLAPAVDRLLEERANARLEAKAEERADLQAMAEQILADSAGQRVVGPVTVYFCATDLPRDALMELSRRLTRVPDRVAILTSERDGRGLLFIGSSAGRVAASELLAQVQSRFAGKGGGNPSAATAVGSPGAPLAEARQHALERAEAMARGA